MLFLSKCNLYSLCNIFLCLMDARKPRVMQILCECTSRLIIRDENTNFLVFHLFSQERKKVRFSSLYKGKGKKNTTTTCVTDDLDTR